MRYSLIDAIKACLRESDFPVKLIDIFNRVREMGYAQSPSSYMCVYIALREHPEFFERVSQGYYVLRSDAIAETMADSKLDADEARELIVAILNKSPKQTPTQIWRSLQKQGVSISYKAVHNLLQSPEFYKQYGIVINKTAGNRYYVK